MTWFSKSDYSAHSSIQWCWDDSVENSQLIPEIIRLLRANSRGPKFSFSPDYIPLGQVDILARDIAALFQTHGFSKEATDADAEYQWPNDSARRNKLVLIYDLVRGTLLAGGDIRSVS